MTTRKVGDNSCDTLSHRVCRGVGQVIADKCLAQVKSLCPLGEHPSCWTW